MVRLCPRPGRRALALGLIVAASFIVVACGGREAAPEPRGEVRFAVAPLTLQRAWSARWKLLVEAADGQGGWQTVVSSSFTAYGDRGSLTYIAPCVPGPSRVTVTLEEVTDQSGAVIDVVIPPPATRELECFENRDVLAEFDITVMARAQQGFFDVAVEFEDVFCSAKVDCQEDFTHDPRTGERADTLVTGITCTAGEGGDGESTTIGFVDAVMCCANGTRVACTVLEGTPRAGVVDTTRYEGVNAGLGGEYLNTTWTLDEAFLADNGAECFFTAMGYVNTAPLGETPATAYQAGMPALHFEAKVLSDGSCPDSTVTVSYDDVPPNGRADCSPLPEVGPDQLETCNGRDDNCDGTTDDGFVVCEDPPQPGCDCTPSDVDDDGIPDAVDSCPNHANPAQGDVDGDGYGDSCDPDIDGDKVDNAKDNCPGVPNASQGDADGNGIGDACEGLPNDCGDGVIQVGEQCDDAFANSDFLPNACRTSCLFGFCGDGIVDAGEQCDDGNGLTGDGCEAGCVVAPLGGDPVMPTEPLRFGTSTADPYGGWETTGDFEISRSSAIPEEHACIHGGPLAPIGGSIASPMYDTTEWPELVTLSFTAAMLPRTNANPAPYTEGGAGFPSGAGATDGFAGATSSLGAGYGGNLGGGYGGGGWGGGYGGGGGGGWGGWGGGGGGGGWGGYGGGGYGGGWGYPGEGIVTQVQYTTDGGRTWITVESIPGYWSGERSLRIPLLDVQGPGFGVRLVCTGPDAGPTGYYFGVSDLQILPNAPPVLAPAPTEVVLSRGEARTYDFTVTDPDGVPGPVEIRLLGGPSFASWTPTGAGQARLVIAPDASTAYGYYQLAIGTSDGALRNAHWMTIYVPPPPPSAIHHITIRSGPDNTGAPVGDVTLVQGASTTFYAAAYSAADESNPANYIGDVDTYWRHGGTLPEGTTETAFAVYRYTGWIAGTAGVITAQHPYPSVPQASTGTITIVDPPSGPPSLTRSTLTASPSAMVVGSGTTTVTVQLYDAFKIPVGDARAVALQSTLGTFVGSPTYLGRGRYTQVLQAGPTEGTATITATVDGQPLAQTATVTVALPIDPVALGVTTIDCANIAEYEDEDLIVSGALTIDTTTGACGPLRLGLLTIRPTGVLRHPPSTTTTVHALDLDVAALTIEAGGKIDVSGRGYLAQYTFGNVKTGGAPSSAAGGSHGGLGGLASAAVTYDDFKDPRLPGGGGYDAAAAGGGTVFVVARGAVHVDGQILANGLRGTSTGGAGGTINIVAPTISGAGAMQAWGADSGNTSVGAGGGGRIALRGVVTALGNFTPALVGESATACGGNNSGTNTYDGGAGTLWFESRTTPGTLVVNGCNRTPADGSTPFVVLPAGTYTNLDADSADIASLPTAPARFIGSSATFTAVAPTEQGTYDSLVFAPVAGLSSVATGAGGLALDADLTARDPNTARKAAASSGAYRGFTEVGLLRVVNGARVDAVGDLFVRFGSLADPLTFELDGVLTARRLDLGTTGYLTVLDQGDLRVGEGLVSRNTAGYALPATLEGGAVTMFAGQQLASVDASAGGRLAGSGGVVIGPATFRNPAAGALSNVEFRSDLTISGGTWTSTGVVNVGGALSVYGVAFGAETVNVGGDARFEAGTVLTLTGLGNGVVAAGDIIALGQNTKLTHTSPASSQTPRALELTATNVRVFAPAVIDVSGVGWAGSSGPAGLAAPGLSGGGHGGRGAHATPTSRSQVFDSLVSPVLPGGGGGNGGYGGGAVVIVAEQAIAIASATANATTSSTGGAGGTINLRAGESISVSGTLEARGAPASNAVYGSGAGGRVSLSATGRPGVPGALQGALATDPRSIIDVRGGIYSNVGAGAGTVWLEDATGTTLIVDNEDLAGTQADSTPLPVMGRGQLNVSGGGLAPAVASAWTKNDTLVGQRLLADPDSGTPTLADDTRFTVAGVDASGNWLLSPDPAAFAGAGHTWCTLLEVDRLVVAGNAQLTSTGCVRVRRSPATLPLSGGLAIDLLELEGATALAITGPNNRFDVRRQVAQGLADFPFTTTLAGTLTATLSPLRLGALTTTATSTLTALEVTIAGHVAWTGGSLALDGLAASGDMTFTNAAITLGGHGTGLTAGGRLTITGPSAVVSHQTYGTNNTDTRKVLLTGDIVELLDGAKIDAKGRGYRAGYGLSSFIADSYEGASHIGLGGASNPANAPRSYDNIYRPSLAGGGGGTGAAAIGGGVVHVIATTRAIVGVIDASAAATSTTSGGAGGAIYLAAPVVEVNGVLSVRGGDGYTAYGYYPGGGGAIAIDAGTDLTGTLGDGPRRDMVVLRGGAYGTISAAGSGTLYVEEGPGPGDLLVDNQDATGTLSDSTLLPFRWYGAASAASATTLTISQAPTYVPVGYQANPNLAQGTPSLADDQAVTVSAGTSGSAVLTVAPDPTAVWTSGAQGCAMYRFRNLDIVRRAQLTVDGCLRVDAANLGGPVATWTLDGGLNAKLVDLAGVETIVLSGPQARFDVGTQIAQGTANYPFDLQLTNATLTSASVLGGNLTATGTTVSLSGNLALTGDLALTSTTLAAAQLTVGGGAVLTGGQSTLDGLQATGDIVFASGHRVEVRGLGAGIVSTGGSVRFLGTGTQGTHSAHVGSGEQRELRVQAALDLEVGSSAVLDVTAKGYQGVTSGRAHGPDSTIGAGASTGGSHGGLGTGSDRRAYDNLYDPTWAGGGGGPWNGGTGSTGGGVILLTAGRDLTLDKAYANAAVAASNASGGAGGAVNLKAGGKLTIGLVEARGASGGGGTGPAGGGGLVAIQATELLGALARPTYDATFDAAIDLRGGATSAAAAGAGLVFIRSSTYENGVLIADNEGQTTARDSTPLRGGRTAITAAGADYIDVASTTPLSVWTPVGLEISVDVAEGTDSLADNTRFTVLARSGSRLTLDGDPRPITSAPGASGQWSFIHVFDHLEISDAQVDATDVLLRVEDGSLLTGQDEVFGLAGALADTRTESSPTSGATVLDLDTVTDLAFTTSQARFDIAHQVQGDTLSPAWSRVTASGALELDRLRVAALAASDITATLTDVGTLEAVSDLVLSNVSVELTGLGDGLVAGDAATLDLTGTTTVTHQAHAAAAEVREARLAAGTVHVAATASINVDGRGYPGNVAPTGITAPSSGQGGNHCGRGYNGPATGVFDDPFAPSLAGSGSGTGNAFGGGVIRIDAVSLADVDGALSANGKTASGGAAGGSVYVTADTIALSGTAQARGADSTSGAGGGGCIALVADTTLTGPITGATPWTRLLAYGGYGNASQAGGAGLVYLQSDAADDGTLVAWNNDYTGTQEDSTLLPAIPVGTITGATGNTLTVSGATLSPLRPSSRLSLRLVTPDETPRLDDELLRKVTASTSTTLTLDAAAAPFAGAAYASYYRFDELEVGGNAHLKSDAHLRLDAASLSGTTAEFVMKGGLASPHVDFGDVARLVISGGASRFDVPKDVAAGVLDPTWDPALSGTLRLPALATLDLTASSLVLKDVTRLTVTGHLTFTDTRCTSCVTLDATGDIAWERGTFDVRALRAGADLTLTDTNVSLHGEATNLPAGFTDGLVAGDDLVMRGTSFVLTHYAAPRTVGLASVRRANLAGKTVTLGAGATINVAAMGFGGGLSGDPSGLAHLTSLRAGSSGGSHLGNGAASNVANMPATFDAYFAPTLPGGGGGYYSGNGGNGGGVVRIAAIEGVVLDGTILATGQAGTSSGMGGAGGAVYATGAALAMNGVIDVRGGASTNYGGGGGGIALVADTLTGKPVSATPWADLRAAGGSGSVAGGAGTIFLRARSLDDFGHLIVDNDNLANTMGSSTTLVFSRTGTWANNGVTYDAGPDTTALVSATGGLDTHHAPVGYFVNPRVGQPFGAVTPTLADDLVFPITAATPTALTVSGDASLVTAPGATYRPRYDLDTLTVIGNAQLRADAEIFVDEGHWQDGELTFSVTGGLDVTTLDLDAVTHVAVLGPQAGWDIDNIIARGEADPRFEVDLSGTVKLASLKTFSLTESSLNLTISGRLDALGDVVLTGSYLSMTGDLAVSNDLRMTSSTLAGATATTDLVIGGDASFIDTSVTASTLTAASATLSDTNSPRNNAVNIANGITITGTLTLDNADVTSKRVSAGTLLADAGYYDIDDIVVVGDLVSVGSADFITNTISATNASFGGAEGDVRYRAMSIGDDLTFSGGTRFEANGGLADKIVAGGTVLLTGTGTAGTHIPHPSIGSRVALVIEAADILIEAGARLDVDGKGYQGVYAQAGHAPSEDLRPAARAGGSHLGLSHGDAASSRRSYDDLARPSWAGAGGGLVDFQQRACCGYSCSYYCYPTYYDTGGAGGGVVQLVASGLIDIDGDIEARGINGRVVSGAEVYGDVTGGGGGAVYARAAIIDVSGEVMVAGGSGRNRTTDYSTYYYKGGGGGAVALVATARVGGKLASATPWTAVDLRGGVRSTDVSGTGTFYLEVAGRRTLIVDARGQSPQDASTPLPFSGGSTIQSFPSAAAFTTTSSATFTKWAPIGYELSPDIAQGDPTTLTDDEVFRVVAADAGTRVITLDADPSAVASVGDTWMPFYAFDWIEIRGGARVAVDAQVLVWEGSLTAPGTAGTTALGSPGQVAVNGALSVSGTNARLEVARVDRVAFATARDDIPGDDLEGFAETELLTTFDGPLAAADALCQAEAASVPALAGRRFAAWLSTSTSAARDRLPYNTRYTTTASPASSIASGRPDLIDGALTTAIGLDAAGNPVTGPAWTGTSSAGQAVTGGTCGDWRTIGTGQAGDVAAIDATWTQQASIDCASTARLYCFEIP